jgi:hypothetical protein
MWFLMDYAGVESQVVEVSSEFEVSSELGFLGL